MRSSLLESNQASLDRREPPFAGETQTECDVGRGYAQVRSQFEDLLRLESAHQVEEQPTLVGRGARAGGESERLVVSVPVGKVGECAQRSRVVQQAVTDGVDATQLFGGAPEPLLHELCESLLQNLLRGTQVLVLAEPTTGGFFQAGTLDHWSLLYTSSSFCFSTPQLYRCLAWRQAARYGSGSARILRVAAAKASGSTGSTPSPTPVSATTLPMPGESDPSTGTSAIMYSKSLLGRVV